MTLAVAIFLAACVVFALAFIVAIASMIGLKVYDWLASLLRRVTA